MSATVVGLSMTSGRAGVSAMSASCADGETRRELDPPLSGRAMSTVAAEVMRVHRSRTGCGWQRVGDGVA